MDSVIADPAGSVPAAEPAQVKKFTTGMKKFITELSPAEREQFLNQFPVALRAMFKAKMDSVITDPAGSVPAAEPAQVKKFITDMSPAEREQFLNQFPVALRAQVKAKMDSVIADPAGSVPAAEPAQVNKFIT